MDEVDSIAEPAVFSSQPIIQQTIPGRNIICDDDDDSLSIISEHTEPASQQCSDIESNYTLGVDNDDFVRHYSIQLESDPALEKLALDYSITRLAQEEICRGSGLQYQDEELGKIAKRNKEILAMKQRDLGTSPIKRIKKSPSRTTTLAKVEMSKKVVQNLTRSSKEDIISDAVEKPIELNRYKDCSVDREAPYENWGYDYGSCHQTSPDKDANFVRTLSEDEDDIPATKYATSNISHRLELNGNEFGRRTKLASPNIDHVISGMVEEEERRAAGSEKNLSVEIRKSTGSNILVLSDDELEDVAKSYVDRMSAESLYLTNDKQIQNGGGKLQTSWIELSCPTDDQVDEAEKIEQTAQISKKLLEERRSDNEDLRKIAMLQRKQFQLESENSVEEDTVVVNPSSESWNEEENSDEDDNIGKVNSTVKYSSDLKNVDRVLNDDDDEDDDDEDEKEEEAGHDVENWNESEEEISRYDQKTSSSKVFEIPRQVNYDDGDGEVDDIEAMLASRMDVSSSEYGKRMPNSSNEVDFQKRRISVPEEGVEIESDAEELEEQSKIVSQSYPANFQREIGDDDQDEERDEEVEENEDVEERDKKEENEVDVEEQDEEEEEENEGVEERDKKEENEVDVEEQDEEEKEENEEKVSEYRVRVISKSSQEPAKYSAGDEDFWSKSKMTFDEDEDDENEAEEGDEDGVDDAKCQVKREVENYREDGTGEVDGDENSNSEYKLDKDSLHDNLRRTNDKDSDQIDISEEESRTVVKSGSIVQCSTIAEESVPGE